jgi:glutamate synthase (NADPH/NADH) large chain
LFAQVTNPPIDPIREAIVMSLVSFIGPKPNLLDINQVNPPMRLEVSQPMLDFADMAKLRDIEQHTQGKFRSVTLDITYPLAWGHEGCGGQAGLAVRRGGGRHQGRQEHPHHQRPRRQRHPGGHSRAAGLSAIHQHLVREGLRTTAGLVVETGTAREVHHFAVLAGYGAEAVHPYLAMETLAAIHKDLTGDLSAEKAIYNYVKAVGKGLSKIMSKMGVSTYMSYCGAQLFEAIGLNSATVAKYFTGTPAGSKASACSRSPRKPSACTRRRLVTTRCWPPCWTPAANTPGAPAAKSTCGRPTPLPSCSTAPAPTTGTPTRNTPRSSTTRASAT